MRYYLLGLLAIVLFTSAAILSCQQDTQRAQARDQYHRQTMAFYDSLGVLFDRQNTVMDSIEVNIDSINVMIGVIKGSNRP